QKRDQRNDRQRVGADALADYPDILPANRRRMPRGMNKRGGGLADEADLLAYVGADARGDDADLLDRGATRLRRIEIVIDLMNIELLEQRLEGRREVCDLYVARLALPDQIDQ